MWDPTIGRKEAEFFVLGSSSVPLYLYRFADGWALFEGGLAMMGAQVLKQVKEIVGELSLVRYWFITHAHYDHCALLPPLIKHFPNATVIASEKGAQAFCSPRAQQVVVSLNYAVASSCENGGEATPIPGLEPAPWESLPVRVMGDGESLELGRGTSVKAIYTPGHSRCSMSYLIEQAGLLFVSDALGEVIAPSRFLPLVFDDAKAYQSSLEKLGEVAPAVVALGHHGILKGTLAASAARDASVSLERLKSTVKGHGAGEQKMEVLANELTDEYWGGSREFLPHELHLKSMIRMLGLLQ